MNRARVARPANSKSVMVRSVMCHPVRYPSIAGHQARSAHCGTLPDFGNFRVSQTENYDRYKGVTELMPFAKAVSAKTNDFDERGEDTQTDYHKMMKIVLDAGYRGFVGIEYEGEKMSEADGIKATKKLLERVHAELSKNVK